MSQQQQQQSPFSNTCLNGQVALITGGGSGIGFEIAKQLVLHGASVVLMGRRESFLSEAAEAIRKEIQLVNNNNSNSNSNSNSNGHNNNNGNGSGSQVDVTSASDKVGYVVGDVRQIASAQSAIEYTKRRFGRLDALINGAAGNFLCAAEHLSPNGLRTVLEIDTIGCFVMSSAAFPLLKQSSYPCIINISATLHYSATWYQLHASAAKAAIDSMTRTLALEWGTYGIRVNGIAPGPIAETAGMTKLAPGADQSMIEAAISQRVPLGRMGTKWDIAMSTLFLLSNASSYISGATLVVDGAAWMYTEPSIPREMVAELSRKVESKSRAVGGAGDASTSVKQPAKL